jgi:hypothetical protein
MNAFDEHPQYALLWHYQNPQKPDHFDLVIQTGPTGTPLQKYESFSIFEFTYQQNVDVKYLEFEGQMTNDRGKIIRLERNSIFLLPTGDIAFHGRILFGTYALTDLEKIVRK